MKKLILIIFLIYASGCELKKYERHEIDLAADHDSEDCSYDDDSFENEVESHDDSYENFDDENDDENDDCIDSDAYDVDSNDNDFIDFYKDLGLLQTDVLYDLNFKIPFQSAFFDGGVTAYEGTLDEKGVPLTNGDYHPSNIAQYVINLYVEHLMDGDNDQIIEKMRPSVDWLYENAIEEEDYSKWIFNMPAFLVEPPWSSALTNSWGAMALIYGAYFFPEKRSEYLKMVAKSINYIFISMHNDGALSYWNNGSIWFEEYPNIETPTHVLNGFLFALDALVIFDTLFPGTVVKDNIMFSFSSLEANVHEFDGGYGSFYDAYLKGNKLGSNYHKIHWTQLAWAFYKTNIEILGTISQRWFEADNQTVVEATASRSINSETHGPGRLNDGTYWYHYWSSLMPVDIRLKLEKEYEVYGINIFNNEGFEPKDYSISYYDSEGSLKTIDNENMYFLPDGRNVTSSETTTYRTSVSVVRFKNPVKTTELLLRITTSNDLKIVSVREIGVMKKMTDSYWLEIDKISEKQNWKYTSKYY